MPSRGPTAAAARWLSPSVLRAGETQLSFLAGLTGVLVSWDNYTADAAMEGAAAWYAIELVRAADGAVLANATANASFPATLLSLPAPLALPETYTVRLAPLEPVRSVRREWRRLLVVGGRGQRLNHCLFRGPKTCRRDPAP